MKCLTVVGGVQAAGRLVQFVRGEKVSVVTCLTCGMPTAAENRATHPMPSQPMAAPSSLSEDFYCLDVPLDASVRTDSVRLGLRRVFQQHERLETPQECGTCDR